MIHTGTELPPLINNSFNNSLPNYDSPSELRAFLSKYEIGMRKKFGQNFLINPSMRSMLLDALDLPPGEEVWEVGPGLGAMTKGLLERGGRVTAFEIDPGFSGLLREFFGGDPAFHLVEGDVLKTWKTVSGGSEVFLLGNLPYNIAAALLADLIGKGRFFKRMVVTVQREVALRMAAAPGSKDYSSFSVLCSSVYKVNLLKIISASSFYPAPRVDSQAVRMDLLSESFNFPRFFYPLVRKLFSQRRKTIMNTLTTFASSVIMKPGLSAREAAMETLRVANVSPSRRAETLEKYEFAALAAALEEIVTHGT